MTITLNFDLTGKYKIIFVCSPLTAYFMYTTFQDRFCFINKRDIVTKLFNRFHVVSRKNYSSSSFPQEQDFIFYNFCIQGIKSCKWLIKDQQFWFVEYCYHKLD